MNAEFSQLFPSDFPDKVKDLLNSKYPLPPNSGRFTYGTAGFRTKGIILPPVAARVIFIAMLRSWYHRGNSQRGSSGSSIGLMITASHNPPADNGFKIIDVDGGMLTTSWEKWCTKAANTKSGDDFLCVIHECIIAEKIAVPQAKEKTPSTILLGRDTRDSGDSILKAITDVLDTVFINDGYRDFGIVATPQLHFLVARMNSLPCDKCDSLDEGSYFEELLNSFANLMEVANCRSPRRIVVDAANGVGALTLRRLIEYSEKHSNTLSKYLNFTVVNDNTDCSDKLNLECGADYAKQYSIPSSSMKRWEDSPQKNSDIHFYCLDGDAVRLVAFDLDTRNDEKWRLIDGDRLLALYTRLLIHLLGEPALLAANFGVVQTAYANGASTEFLRDFLNVKTYITATGVKNLHHVASSCGIGAYFEANGHGTVLFNRESCDKAIAFYCSNLPEIDREKEKCRLSLIFDNLPRLFSQTCGDAIADLLACEFALSFTALPYRMVHPMFSDRPFILSKVHVDNPMITTRADDETKVVTPCGMQSTIDAAVQRTIDSLRQAGHQGRGLYARCFVRQSGTEPVVRVYAEASTKEACSILSSEVERIVSEACSSHDTA